jgi:hypothetical protein
MAEDNQPQLVAKIDFDCQTEACETSIQFNLMGLKENGGQVVCQKCHSPYQFDREFLTKLQKLRNLVIAVHDAEDIIDETNVAVTTPAGEVKLPYRLLLTRLNTIITIQGINFNFRVEPLNPDETFK